MFSVVSRRNGLVVETPLPPHLRLHLVKNNRYHNNSNISYHVALIHDKYNDMG